MVQILLPLAALAAVVASLVAPEVEKRPARAEENAEAAPHPSPDAAATPGPALPREEPWVPRPASAFPGGEPWEFGSLRGTQWKPQRAQKAWLLVLPAAGEEASHAAALLRNLWSAREIGAILLAAPPTPAAADAVAERQAADQLWGQALDGLAAQQPAAMAVLLGSGSAGEAALRWAADPRVMAVAALDVGAELPWLASPDWRGEAAKKHLWLGGPVARAQDADRLSRGLPHARPVTRGGERGLQWLSVADQRAALSGWLASVLGR